MISDNVFIIGTYRNSFYLTQYSNTSIRIDIEKSDIDLYLTDVFDI